MLSQQNNLALFHQMRSSYYSALLRPPVVTVRIGADIVQSHLRGCLYSVRLEEDSLPVPALRAWVVLRPGQGGVPHNISHNVGDLVHLVHNLVHIYAARVSQLAIVTIPAGIQQHFVVLVLLRVEHVVTLLAEPDTNKARTFSTHVFI